MKVLVLFLVFESCLGSVFYVDPAKDVATERDGTWAAPFSNISSCVSKLSGPGDQCQIRAGVYHEDIQIAGVRGTPDKPVLITGYQDERPVIDGTVQITPLSGEWDVKDGVYSGHISRVIWQLFLDDTMMTNARWPNALWSDRSVFNGSRWAGVGEHGTKIDLAQELGTIENRGDGLRNTGVSMKDAVAVMNIGKWNTFVAKVKDHEVNQNNFTYHHTFGNFTIETKLSRYFLEDKLELLDVPGEWHFDKATKLLTFIPPTKTDMGTAKLRGKVQSYALTITDSQYLVIKNMDFFGTTIRAYSTSRKSTVDKLTFHSLNFRYPSYSKRMLGDIGLIKWMDINGLVNKGSFHFYNNTFFGSDGAALAYHGAGTRLEHNHFEYNDWTSANMLRYAGGKATILSYSRDDVITRNTLVNNGNGCGIRPGLTSNVTLNLIRGQCFGFQQNDGAGIQITRKPQQWSRIENNWIYDSPKYGLRFDGERPKIGFNGTVSGNVVLNTNGIQIKGDYHTASNNLALRSATDLFKPEKCSLCVWKTVRKNLGVINEHSIVINNLADQANGGVMYGEDMKRVVIDGVIQTWPLQGQVVENNLIDREGVRDWLVDPDNLDFRPRRGRPVDEMGVGPYRVSYRNYWVPGRQTDQASTPVPPHNSTTVLAGRRWHVMWLNGINSQSHQVYLGASESAVQSASPSGGAFLGTRRRGSNIMRLSSRLEPGTRYYWRVDAVLETGHVIKGEVWNFTTV